MPSLLNESPFFVDSISQDTKSVNSFSENSRNKFSDRDPELAAQREKVNKVLESENAKRKEDNQYLKMECHINSYVFCDIPSGSLNDIS